MSALAVKHGATNLGQGFPDFGWPEEVLAKAAEAVTQGSNQYPPSRGLPVLRQAIASFYGRHYGEEIAPEHVVVTVGATEALAAMINVIVQPGDEVIIFTPAFDAYIPMIRRAGGVPVEVRLAAPGFDLDGGAIAAAITPRTRAILLNNPHNPAGRLYTSEEMAPLAALAEQHDLTVIADEVYEQMLLNEGDHFTPFASLPGMAARTFKCGSAGKLFSLTGWKVGWVVAPRGAEDSIAKAHQFLTFATAPALQAAVAHGLDHDLGLADQRRGFARARDRMLNGLADAGYVAIHPAATYFCAVDLAASGMGLDDHAFARMAVEQAGVAVVPFRPFYLDNPDTHLVRLCFAKPDSIIDAGLEGMRRAKLL
ncbi:aminotransferase class I/II-fold pyridoxal phosphate-dependent enzyme [Sphingomicrobium flavum]|uniref:aminotransferase class I/II-fold pyridoxal phosphate-dependent enzyme n=1 Tax=Sphingomicrobium flavum TaxID=1229164 RepID=UPI0021AE2740|nr:aminotransferase class I/II-fold pyridoxal phosphate-dependent enzyme [Sphingomicrobium flavum]